MYRPSDSRSRSFSSQRSDNGRTISSSNASKLRSRRSSVRRSNRQAASVVAATQEKPKAIKRNQAWEFKKKIGNASFRFATIDSKQINDVKKGTHISLWLWDEATQTWLRGWAHVASEQKLYFARGGTNETLALDLKTGDVEKKKARGIHEVSPPPLGTGS